MPPFDWTHLATIVAGGVLTWLYNRMGNQPKPPAPNPDPPPTPSLPLLGPGRISIGNGELLSLLLNAFFSPPPNSMPTPVVKPASPPAVPGIDVDLLKQLIKEAVAEQMRLRPVS